MTYGQQCISVVRKHFPRLRHPNVGAAIVEAPDRESAIQRLSELIGSDATRPETVWEDEDTDPDTWKVTEVGEGFMFVLGNGCR